MGARRRTRSRAPTEDDAMLSTPSRPVVFFRWTSLLLFRLGLVAGEGCLLFSCRIAVFRASANFRLETNISTFRRSFPRLLTKNERNGKQPQMLEEEEHDSARYGDVLVFGYASTLFPPTDASQESSARLVPWGGDGSCLVDRFDVRLLFDDDFEFRPSRTPLVLSVEDRLIEEQCEHERFRDLRDDGDEIDLYEGWIRPLNPLNMSESDVALFWPCGWGNLFSPLRSFSSQSSY
eukprot:m.851661 g.851661  ORF g.851661 m.851661 type:complete len:235 (+) comp59590_c1_seq7:1222-1926(+)